MAGLRCRLCIMLIDLYMGSISRPPSQKCRKGNFAKFVFQTLNYMVSSKHIYVHFDSFTPELVPITSESLARPSL